MDDETNHRLQRLEQRMEAIYQSVEKTRKYILVMVIVAAVTIVLPLLALAVVVPMVLRTLGTAYGGLF